MTKTLTLAVLMAASAMAFAQGTVSFVNGTGLVKQWTSVSDPTPIVSGPDGRVVLLGAVSDNALLSPPVTTTSGGYFANYSSLSAFLTANPGWYVVADTGLMPFMAGLFDGGEVTLPGVPPGATAEYVVLGWTGSFATYDEALASGTAFIGVSPVFTTGTGDPLATPPVPPVSLENSFTGLLETPPAPSPFVLDRLGAGADEFGFTVTGAPGTVVMVDACADLANPDWLALPGFTLTNGSAYFSEAGGAGQPARFYRVYAQTLSNALHHQQANQTIPMGTIWPGYGSNYASYELILGIAQSMNTNGLVQHGYNTVLMNCGTLSSSRDANGNLQIGQPTVINVTNLISDLLTNGCYFGLHFYATVPGGTLDECGSLVMGPNDVYHDGYTLGSWGVRQVWEGGTGFIPEADFRFISEAFHAGLYDGAAAGGWPYLPNSMVSTAEGRNYPWVPEVWNLAYVRAADGGDMNTVGVAAWQDAFFFSMQNYDWMFTAGSSPTLEGISVYATGDGTQWVTTDALRFVFGMNCMNSMPLYIEGATILPNEMEVITNDAAIAIDQDPLRAPPYLLSSDATSAVVTKQLLDGDVAVALWNLSTNSATEISVSLASIPGVQSDTVSVVDIFDGSILAATNSLTATVNPSGLNLYRLRAGGNPPEVPLF